MSPVHADTTSTGVRRVEASLVDVLDRTLRTGVAVRAEIELSIAGVDLVTIDLRAVLASAATVHRMRRGSDERS